MKNYWVALVLLNACFTFCVQAQNVSATDSLVDEIDSIIPCDPSKCRIGAKIICEQSGDYSMKPYVYQVYGTGAQFIRRFGNSASSIESGLYLVNKAAEYTYFKIELRWDPFLQDTGIFVDYVPVMIHYHNLSIPINYRFDSRFIYFTGGIMLDYLVAETVNNKGYIDSVGYKKDEIRKFNWGYNLTVGGERCFNTKLRIFAEIRYSYTLSSSKTRGDFLYNPSYRNWGFATGFNYKLF